MLPESDEDLLYCWKVQLLTSVDDVTFNILDQPPLWGFIKVLSYFVSVKNIRTCQPQITGNAVPPAARSAKSDGNLFSNKVTKYIDFFFFFFGSSP